MSVPSTGEGSPQVNSKAVKEVEKLFKDVSDVNTLIHSVMKDVFKNNTKKITEEEVKEQGMNLVQSRVELDIIKELIRDPEIRIRSSEELTEKYGSLSKEDVGNIPPNEITSVDKENLLKLKEDPNLKFRGSKDLRTQADKLRNNFNQKLQKKVDSSMQSIFFGEDKILRKKSEVLKRVAEAVVDKLSKNKLYFTNDAEKVKKDVAGSINPYSKLRGKIQIAGAGDPTANAIVKIFADRPRRRRVLRRIKIDPWVTRLNKFKKNLEDSAWTQSIPEEKLQQFDKALEDRTKINDWGAFKKEAEIKDDEHYTTYQNRAWNIGYKEILEARESSKGEKREDRVDRFIGIVNRNYVSLFGSEKLKEIFEKVGGETGNSYEKLLEEVGRLEQSDDNYSEKNDDLTLLKDILRMATEEA